MLRQLNAQQVPQLMELEVKQNAPHVQMGVFAQIQRKLNVTRHKISRMPNLSWNYFILILVGPAKYLQIKWTKLITQDSVSWEVWM